MAESSFAPVAGVFRDVLRGRNVFAMDGFCGGSRYLCRTFADQPALSVRRARRHRGAQAVGIFHAENDI